MSITSAARSSGRSFVEALYESYLADWRYFTSWYPVIVAARFGADSAVSSMRLYPGVRTVCAKRPSRFLLSSGSCIVSQPGCEVKGVPSFIRYMLAMFFSRPGRPIVMLVR